MKLAAISPRLIGAALLIAVGVASCFAEPKGNVSSSSTGGSSTGGVMSLGESAGMPDATAGVPALPACYARPVTEGADCRPVKSAEPYLARIVAGVATAQTVFVDDLFASFKSHCGGCHVSNKLGNFQVTRTNFSQVVDAKVLLAIKSNTELCELDDKGEKVDKDCYDYMPPAGAFGKPWSEREKDAGDAVHRLANLLDAWLSAGSPADQFLVQPDENAPAPYTVDDDLARSLTHIGTCIPDAGLVATELDESCALDALFAASERKPDGTPEERVGLPVRLDQTDLYTFDSKELARHGVIAYAPTYPLWTDGAGKLRHIRLPRGYDADGKELSIHFNPDTKQFEIPDNTRFYKTFMRQVKTLDGSERYRKIETRLIVARANNAALFGTYEWNADETEATLMVEPLRNGEPFADKLKTIVIDEPLDADIHARFEAGEFGKYANLTYQEDKQHVLRRYAIPGSNRCVQCHQGSPSNSFVLGFSPLQVNQRPCDASTLETKGHCEGGLLNATGPDEVNQLQRLIDYGVITGYDPQADLVKLEDAQGTGRAARPMRGEEELVAQSYMLGNCSHCHNPHGYATNQNPELEKLLNFLPSDVGGIFQFPLERYSPRIKRGVQGNVQIPYITPHLYDFQTTGPYSKVVGIPGMDGQVTNVPIPAPWRSLIYRNTDTPFTYTDDSAIYPHMPLNMPGYDCRITRILGDWMVSIPAVPKDYGQLPEQGEMQAVVEVKPDDPRYLNAVDLMQKRLKAFHEGQRYNYCPDQSDIVDIDVMRGKRLIPQDHTVADAPVEGVPDRSHWVVTDLTDPPPPWNPRRVDWKDVIGEGGKVLPLTPDEMKDDKRVAAWNAQVRAVGLDRTASIGKDFETFATTPLKFALWDPNPKCKLDSAETLADARKQKSHPRWMDEIGEAADAAHVYESLPGAAVFNMICVNCHGTEADSGGRQASTLQEMTGGNGRVANFRDGLFGPYGEHGANRARVFGADGKSDDEKAALGQEWASRYMAWMALGGTTTQIPDPILRLVAQTPVAGLSRPVIKQTDTANMLQVAQKLCSDIALLGTTNGDAGTFHQDALGTKPGYEGLFSGSGLIVQNGDAELWMKLCTFDNTAPIHVMTVLPNGPDDFKLWSSAQDLYCSQAYAYTSDRFSCLTGYPAGTPIGNMSGGVDASLSLDNFFPWCVKVGSGDTDAKAWVAKQKAADGKPLPLCPDAFAVPENRFQTDPGIKYGVDVWSTRGAINAGFSVFMYLRDFIGEGKPRAYRFNECELYEQQLGLKAP